MHRATTRAFHAAGDPAQFPEDGLEPYQPAKLYYNTFPRAILRTRVWMARLHGEDPRRWGRNHDIDMVEILTRQLPAHARINVGPYQNAWDDASGCHASQMNPRQSSSGLIDRVVRMLYHDQYFTRAYPEPNGKDRQETDLFEGIG
jgi:N-acetyl-1-D-myo-inositol-2-amino-2-deoxy-alpha-D-glucopyranoside deacetylase/mycothiol S-conjugate amidase